MDDKFKKDGVYPNTSRAEYESITGVNQSLLKWFRRTPAHAKQEMEMPSAPTDSMELGSAIHCAILEPTRFAKEYVIAPKVDRRTTIGKNAWADFEANNIGKEHISAADAEIIRGMQESVYAHPEVKLFMAAKGSNELGVVWTDKKTGLRCKGLIDRINQWTGWTVVVDFKSCTSAAQWDFEKAVAKYGYHLQAAAYLEGLNALAPMERRFLFVAIEKKPPYCCAIYELDEPSLRTGQILFREYLDQYANCMKTGVWPGYRQSVMQIQIPRYEMLGEDV